jgi:ribose transport system ATP-binding protein
VDLDLHAGEVLGIAGLEGSGRDELAGALFGASPRTGDVSVDDSVIPGFRPHLSMRAGMGFVPGDRHVAGLILDMNVRENLTLAGLAPYWQGMVLRGKREQSDVHHWISRLQIRTSGPDSPVGTLSGGNQQKVVVGKWLRKNPRVLLLDEPTQGVDVGAKQEIHSLLTEYAAQGAGVVVCSSDEAELTEVCTRVIVLRGGTMVAELRGADITRSRIMELSMHDATERMGV